MGWACETEPGRNGAFRNLLRNIHGIVEERAKDVTSGLGSSAPQLGADDVGEMLDILYAMISDHARYRSNLRKQLGDFYDPRIAGNGMMIDNREQAAEHLAAVRAEARLCGRQPPETWHDMDEEWMHTKD